MMEELRSEEQARYDYVQEAFGGTGDEMNDDDYQNDIAAENAAMEQDEREIEELARQDMREPFF